MSEDLFVIGVPIVEKVVRTLAVYLAVLVILRVAGKRNLAQLNSFDLVVLLLLSNVVQNAVIGPDDSLLGGLVGAAVLVGANAAVVHVVIRSDRAVHLIEGTSTVLVADGHIDHQALRRQGLRRSEVVAAVLRQGADEIGDVERATLSPGGEVMVRLRPQEMAATRGDLARLEAKLDRLLATLPGPAPAPRGR